MNEDVERLRSGCTENGEKKHKIDIVNADKKKEVQNYADRLKEYPNKGICGLPESYDTSRSLNNKVERLAKLSKNSKHTVVITGKKNV